MQGQRPESKPINPERVATSLHVNDRPPASAGAAGAIANRTDANEPIARWENEGGSVAITAAGTRR
jgi:hypothetical protein